MTTVQMMIMKDDDGGHNARMETTRWMFQENVFGPNTASWNTRAMEGANNVARAPWLFSRNAHLDARNAAKRPIHARSIQLCKSPRANWASVGCA